MIMLSSLNDDPFGTSPRHLNGVNQTIYVILDEVDAHCARAQNLRAQRSSARSRARITAAAATRHEIQREDLDLGIYCPS